MAGARRFTMVEGTSAKFWHIALGSASYEVHFGRIGTLGQRKAKSFPDESAAQAEYAKLIREKLGKGYREVSDANDDAQATPAPVQAAAQRSRTIATKAAVPVNAAAPVSLPERTPPPRAPAAPVRPTERLDVLVDLSDVPPVADETTPQELQALAARELTGAVLEAYNKLEPIYGDSARARFVRADPHGFGRLSAMERGVLLLWFMRELLRSRRSGWMRQSAERGGWHNIRVAALKILLALPIELDGARTWQLVRLTRWLASWGFEISWRALGDLVLASLRTSNVNTHLLIDLEKLERALVLGFEGDTAANGAELLERVRAIRQELGGGRLDALPLDTTDPWGTLFALHLERCPEAVQAGWTALMAHAGLAKGSKPSASWLRAAAPLTSALGEGEFSALFECWTRDLPIPKSLSFTYQLPLCKANQALFRALTWCWLLLPPEERSAPMERLASLGHRKIANYGAAMPTVGSAALHVLEQTDLPAAAAALLRLEKAIRYARVKGRIDKGLETKAEAADMTKRDLADLSIPRLGIDAQGSLPIAVGHGFELVLECSLTGITQAWVDQAGARHASPPAALRKRAPDLVKTATKRAKELRQALSDVARRFEDGYVQQRTFLFAPFSERFLEHDTAVWIARRLLWEVEPPGRAATIIGYNGQAWVDAVGNPQTPAPDARLRLWHPIHSSAEQIETWRDFIATHGVTQPFKQAHREVYRLTPAEIESADHSARFAGQTLKQHMFAELAKSRGFQYSLQGNFDSHNEPTLELPDHDLRVRWEMEPIEHAASSDAGMYLYVLSGALHFFDLEGGQVRMESLAPAVFSEIMRDVDLFVSVCNLGNEVPRQVDELGELAGAWRDSSFGALRPSAEARRDALARLLPRLAIGPRCRLTERYLVVRGDLRTYSIHLGSGNVSMEPGSEYLCIVQKDADSLDLWLPFEGDAKLSLILSKALLLAADSEITDASITMQIKRTMHGLG
jgi:predicted DNA-binding WGR domain protein